MESAYLRFGQALGANRSDLEESFGKFRNNIRRLGDRFDRGRVPLTMPGAFGVQQHVRERIDIDLNLPLKDRLHAGMGVQIGSPGIDYSREQYELLDVLSDTRMTRDVMEPVLVEHGIVRRNDDSR